VKWALRQVYYREHAYYQENKVFTSNPALLRLQEVTIGGEIFEPVIQILPSGFIASFPSIDKNGTWYIASDGLIEFADGT
jgi:hypothetical protein